MIVNKMTTIEQQVERHALSTPDKPAVVSCGTTTTYAQLWTDVCRRTDELRAAAAPGRLNIFRATADKKFIVEYLSTHRAGMVAMPLEKDLPEARLTALRNEYGTMVLPPADDALESIADVLFTTGSTGRQKGVMVSYRAIIADADNLISSQGFTTDTTFIICGPLNHIGSLSKIWPVLALGGTLVIVDGMKDINSLLGLFDRSGQHLATFMVPASLRMILRFGSKRIKEVAQNIDVIETGGAALSQSDIDGLRRLLPGVRLYNTYASTETGIVTTADFSEGTSPAGCTGRPMRNSAVTITADGRITCSGATVMSGYLGDETLTRAVLHGGTVVTNDLGEIDSDGRLHIKGRQNDVINIGGYKVSPQEIEDAASDIEAVADSICIPFHSDIFGDTMKLIYVVSPGSMLSKRDVARALASKLESYKVPRVFEEADSIRHTFNGKPDRRFYLTGGDEKSDE